jgi:hypothetical protein
MRRPAPETRCVPAPGGRIDAGGAWGYTLRSAAMHEMAMADGMDLLLFLFGWGVRCRTAAGAVERRVRRRVADQVVRRAVGHHPLDATRKVVPVHDRVPVGLLGQRPERGLDVERDQVLVRSLVRVARFLCHERGGRHAEDAESNPSCSDPTRSSNRPPRDQRTFR